MLPSVGDSFIVKCVDEKCATDERDRAIKMLWSVAFEGQKDTTLAGEGEQKDVASKMFFS